MILYTLPEWLLDFCAIAGGIFLSGIGFVCFSVGILILFFVYQLFHDVKK